MTNTTRIRKFIAAAALAAGAGLAIASPASADEGTRSASDATWTSPSRNYDYQSLVAAGCVDAYGYVDEECAERHGTEVEEASTETTEVPASQYSGWLKNFRDATASGSGYWSSAGFDVNLSVVFTDARGVLDWVL